ncbi:FecR family protein [uncultured Dysgonomonas sp.]|uniref:FecR protein domain-containing protein n=1 Tax=uncultured Dysgonomonas sp. TaxID=206096 RepID=A0A212K758_9BACT|nr:FecR family protein [uncultured Dysgonomonas sp.]SBW07486.1 hypothetical protein KL86DYS1_31679 [uncultured Dysgonomonas sp.]
MENNKYIDLLNKYHEGKCSKKELVILFEWINSDEGNTELDTYLTSQIQNEKYLDQITFSTDAEVLLHDIKEEIGIGNPRKLQLRKVKLYAAAAVVAAIVLVGSFSIFWGSENHKHQDVLFAVEKGSKAKVSLRDGSEILLNSESYITYPADKERQFTLTGEAYIHIAKKDKEPFVVHTQHVDILVYGTTFNVNAQPCNQNITVSLIEGSVGIRIQGEENIQYIKPGQTADYNVKTKELNYTTGNLTDIALWRLDELKVENEDIIELCKKLESWYSVKIILKNKPSKTHKYNLSLRQEPIEDVLELISTLAPITYEIKEGKEVVISYIN